MLAFQQMMRYRVEEARVAEVNRILVESQEEREQMYRKAQKEMRYWSKSRRGAGAFDITLPMSMNVRPELFVYSRPAVPRCSLRKTQPTACKPTAQPAATKRRGDEEEPTTNRR